MSKRRYLKQTALWLKTATLASALCLTATATSAQNAPARPANVKAAADYNRVTITWDIPTKMDTLLKEDFEDMVFPPKGWTVKTTNTYDPFYTWFHFPTAEMKDQGIDDEDYATWTHNSKGSAMLMLDASAPHDDNTSAAQDEWLILPQTPGAQYVDFYYSVAAQLKEWGQSDKFPDHYYVKVSHDEGKSWNIVWDARTETAGTDAWQHAVVYLGSPVDGDPIVAFQATSDTSDPSTGLYCSWCVDDVRLLGSLNGADDNTAPAEAYNIYLDDALIAENIKKTEYEDASDKTPGEHTYGVQAVSLSSETESDIVDVKVNVRNAMTNPPTNVKVTYSLDPATNTYNVDMTWEAPKGDRKPDYYMAYANNALIGGYLEDLSVGQTGIPRGFYKYTVKAVYTDPDGESAEVGDVVALGTRQAPYDLKANRNDDNSLALKWTAAKASDHAVTGYALYRGNDKIGETAETSFTEAQSPAGLYDYSVKAVYDDGVQSLPATVSVEHGDKPVYTLPFSEDFTGGLKPGNWTVEKLNGKMKDSYLWRFDNFYELPVSGDGFDQDFASISSSVAGMTNVFSTLDTPPLVRGGKEGDKTFLEFDVDFQTLSNTVVGSASEAGVYFSYDGESWKAIDEQFDGYTSNDLATGKTCAPVHKVYDITDCFNGEDQPIYLAWRYKGRKAHHLAIDNVKVYNAQSASIATAQTRRELSYTVEGQTLRLHAPAISRIQVYSASGACIADVTTDRTDSYALPIAKGLNIVSVTTADGVRTFKVND